MKEELNQSLSKKNDDNQSSNDDDDDENSWFLFGCSINKSNYHCNICIYFYSFEN